MRNHNPAVLKRLKELEEKVDKMHNMIIMLGVVADLLERRGIITRKDIDDHINETTERLKHEAGGKIS